MLTNQIIEIAFTEGVDLKTDPKLVIPSKLLNLENGVFVKGGTIQKRYGYSLYTHNYKPISGSLVIDFDLVPKSLNTYKDELLLSTTNTLLSYGLEKSYWMEKSVISPFISTYETIVNDALSKLFGDMTIYNGIEVYAYEDSEGLKCTVLDSNTKTVYQYNTLIDKDAYGARVVPVGSSVFIFYILDKTGTYDIRAARIGITNPHLILTTYVVGSDNSDGIFLDAIAVGNKGLAIWSKPKGTIEMSFCTQSGIVGSGGAIAIPDALEIMESAETALTVLYNSTSQHIWVVRGNNTDGLGVGIYDLLFNPLAAYAGGFIAIDTYITEALANVTGEFISSTEVQFFYEYDYPIASVFEFQTTKTNTFEESTFAGTPISFKANVGLATKAFKHGDNIFVGVTYASPATTLATFLDNLQPSYFILGSDGKVRGKLMSQKGAGYTIFPLPSITMVGEKFYCALGQSLRLESDSTSVVRSVEGIAKVEMDFDSPYLNFGKEINNIFYFTGGQVEIYDGEICTEAGFHTFPEGVVATRDVAAGNVPLATVLYQVIWQWRDRKGNLHRSSPSPFISCAIDGAKASVVLEIPSLTLTNKPDAIAVIYRQPQNSTLYYKTGSVSNVINSESISFTDISDDATIIGNEILYTLGGELENIAPPSSRLIDVWKNRLFIVTDDESIWYTKERVDTIAMEFNDFGFTKYIHPDGGKTTALVALDANLIVFKQNQIYFINGDGANAFGLNGNLSQMQLITSDVGCIDFNSIVTAPGGILFKTKKGIYILHRELSVEYIGSPVEAYNENAVLSAALHETFNEVRFLLDNNKALVWNYFFNQWSVFTNIHGLDSVVFDDNYVFLDPSGVVYWEDTSKFTDGAVPVQLKIETGWIKLGGVQGFSATHGVQGFQRVYWAHVLGDYLDAHELQMIMSYNYSESIQDTTTWTPDTVLSTTHYGDDSPYGALGSLYGGDSDGVYQYRTKPRIQKCESIKFTFYDVASLGRGYSLSHLLLTVGTKRGGFKLPSKKTI